MTNFNRKRYNLKSPSSGSSSRAEQRRCFHKLLPTPQAKQTGWERRQVSLTTNSQAESIRSRKSQGKQPGENMSLTTTVKFPQRQELPGLTWIVQALT